MRPRKRIMTTVSVAWMGGGKTSQIPFLFCIAARHLLFLTNCSHKTQLNTDSIHFVPVFLEELGSTSTLGVISKTGGNIFLGILLGVRGVPYGYWLDEQGQGSGKLLFLTCLLVAHLFHFCDVFVVRARCRHIGTEIFLPAREGERERAELRYTYRLIVQAEKSSIAERGTLVKSIYNKVNETLS
ncbi:hypothetical protein F5Y00DRAFT_88222 [Daldinia vernicosa]|uniref:uncharacterized protein n=1 Tax=Daldinia vernicosa TaxID=114800 RepID=UPI0020084908|nr:uncharacterized protein F5Y00DRAFT_88222 [Daldinia vernicosa]KAI0848254.1 hypothetical protein F5Y00DRAFT_88222 [Daldinia vernicosa]